MDVKENEKGALELMKEHIHFEWVSNTMGSGFSLTLKDVYGSVIYNHTYLDIFDITEHTDEVETLTEEERQYYYGVWKEDLKTKSFETFVGLCRVKYLYFFL